MENNVVKIVVIASLTVAVFIFGWQCGLHSTQVANTAHEAGCKHHLPTGIGQPDLAQPPVSNHPRRYIEKSLYKLSGKVKGGIFGHIFSQLHHPGAPVTTELLVDTYHEVTEEMKETDPYALCSEVYLTRTGSATSMSNKCIALTVVEDGDTSPYMHGYRMGESAKLINRYQGDTVDSISLREEKVFLPLFVKHLKTLVADFRAKMGEPVLPTGGRKPITIMVANEGVMDLVINFLCSCKASGIATSDNLIVFVGQPDLAPILEELGVKTFYSEALGPIPKKAAGFYGDNVFGVLMWLKTTSLYVASSAGYDVLFQDTDLVWMKDPLPMLQRQEHDIIFMDDGARTPRFTPFYVNSGFYFQKYNERTQFLMEKMLKSISEIAVTHSHQATLTRHLTEAHHLVGLQINVLAQEDYPSGIMFHHNKKYIERMKAHEVEPVVFHMCWTTSREEKVTYFKEIGMWFLPDSESSCESAAGMRKWQQDAASSHSKADLLSHCCKAGTYWEANKGRE